MAPDRIKSVPDAAITGFHMFHAIRARLAATKRALQERKGIDRTKGLLIEARGRQDEEARAMPLKPAMVRGRNVADVAKAWVDVAS